MGSFVGNKICPLKQIPNSIGCTDDCAWLIADQSPDGGTCAVKVIALQHLAQQQKEHPR